MDKPVSLSMKDYLIRTQSVKTNVSERIIEAVINHQFNSAYRALTDKWSIEISGFGKFVFNRKKAKKKMEKFYRMRDAFENMLKQEDITEHKRSSVELKIRIVNQEIETLKPKIDDKA